MLRKPLQFYLPARKPSYIPSWNVIPPTNVIFQRIDGHGLPPIFALVIGIDEYQSPDYNNLACAASDADRFQGFLTDTLKVPQDRIISLRDKNATRAGIVAAFEQLGTDSRIPKNEAAIIIYFAGHGTRDTKPKEWIDWHTPDENIKQLCPSDIGIQVSDSKELIPGIPDRTISRLLNRIAKAKGDNIVRSRLFYTTRLIFPDFGRLDVDLRLLLFK